MKRRTFLESAATLGAASVLPLVRGRVQPTAQLPMVVNTWDFGRAVPATAYDILQRGGSLLDAVEQAVMIPEADPNVTSVGYGGYPDREGKVTLDACIMDGQGNCGSVVFLEHIKHPVSVARLVMEKTQHVLLAGEGALKFALENGFRKENLLTPQAKKAYEQWKKENSPRRTRATSKNHDTIGLLAMDATGKMAGACTTSGMAWKIRGRVGDSPLIGSGLFVDEEVGAATATGIGEAVIKIAGTSFVVEQMRHGALPQEACELALKQVLKKQPKYKSDQGFLVGFLALNTKGEVGAFSYHGGFQYSMMRNSLFSVVDAECLAK
jgi:isoaspartyl peptidase/L-asparaginase-like protein (Ntn-hydrolase superfamily)